MFRWFVGLGIDDRVCNATVFTKNLEGLLAGDVASRFLPRLFSLPAVLPETAQAMAQHPGSMARSPSREGPGREVNGNTPVAQPGFPPPVSEPPLLPTDGAETPGHAVGVLVEYAGIFNPGLASMPKEPPWLPCSWPFPPGSRHCCARSKSMLPPPWPHS